MPHYEEGVVIGNIENKEKPSNLIAKMLIGQFDLSLMKLLDCDEQSNLLELGCGEGRLARMIAAKYDCNYLATDFSHEIIKRAESLTHHSSIHYRVASIYEPEKYLGKYDFVVCCEVLEHLEHPEKSLKSLSNVNAEYFIFSVPNEPMWRILNVFRGKYLQDFGNTPGHLNHWSRKTFLNLLQNSAFKICEIKMPLPWIMVKCKLARPISQ